jgi:ATP-binding cassette subfamily B protein
VALEGVLIAGIAAAQRGLSLCQWLLRAQLGQRVNVMILQKALTLTLRHFEDSEFYDKLTRARREASSRPLSLVMRTFGLVQNGISLISFGTLLIHFSPWAVAILLLAGLPAFIAEAKFSGEAFSLFRWRSPDTRMQMYLETVLARDEHAKEVKLYSLGQRFLDRYQSIFKKLYTADRALAIRRDAWGFALGLVATVALYGAYAWIAVSTVHGLITLGQMTMYVMLFRQGSRPSRRAFRRWAACMRTTFTSPRCMTIWRRRLSSRLARPGVGRILKTACDSRTSGSHTRGLPSRRSRASRFI